uniref:Uncharacterized protein n=1 Tax=Magallana gigas TaxID=29159 RepID=A0A8W8M2S3_MAGGI
MYNNEYSGCYAPNSNSFSPLCINTQSRSNGFGPFNSHASSPLHSSVHQSPYSPSYMSLSFTHRHVLNGASPYHSLGGASRGYHFNSNGVTNGIPPYQTVGGVSDIYHVNRNFSVHTTPSTWDYSSKPHPTSENSEQFSPLPLPTPQKLVTHLQHVESGSASPSLMTTSYLDSRICSRDSVGWIRLLQGQGYFHGDRREIQRHCQDFAVLVTLTFIGLMLSDVGQ